MKKINFILEFKQEQLLKPYIKRDIDLKREAEKEGNGIKKENAKLRNSAIFGKSIECPTKKVDVKFVTTRKQFLKGLLFTKVSIRKKPVNSKSNESFLYNFNFGV